MFLQSLQKSFHRWRDRWNNWVGDREMEQSIRKCISAAGYYGKSAKLAHVQLIAVQRPGWVQVFRFEFTAKRITYDDGADSEPTWISGYGLVTEDARKSISDVRLFQSHSQWLQAFKDASHDLIVLKSQQ